MVEISEVSKGEGSLIARVEAVECFSDCSCFCSRLDGVDIVESHPVVGAVDRPRLSITSTTTHSASVIGEFVGRDPKQPRGDSSWPPAKPAKADQRLLEGGCGDVLGKFPRRGAAHRVGVDAVDVAAIQLGKRIWILTRPFDEPSLVERN